VKESFSFGVVFSISFKGKVAFVLQSRHFAANLIFPGCVIFLTISVAKKCSNLKKIRYILKKPLYL